MVPSGDDRPLSGSEFSELMAALGPFEAAPRLAVAVSGGRDSMALVLLADGWAHSSGGSVVALTVDHRLRSDSGREARQVAKWLDVHRIAHHVLPWRGIKPTSGIQASARRARYDLLLGWCRRRRIRHLLLAHQRDDQLETYVMRSSRGGGLDGLAAMSLLRLDDGVRLLRPLLTVPRARLGATLAQTDQAWIDDPSNDDPAFERVRIRQGMPALEAAGKGASMMYEAVLAAGLDRRTRDHDVASLIAAAVSPSPAGYCLLSTAPLLPARADLRRAVVRRVLMHVGGRTHPPEGRKLDHLVAALDQAPSTVRRTLSGCRVLPWRGRLLIAKERRHPAPAVRFDGASDIVWDRFFCRLRHPRQVEGSACRVQELGSEGWFHLRAANGQLSAAYPAVIRYTLPALWDRMGPVSVPHLGYCRPDARDCGFSAEFRPIHPLVPPAFMVA